MGDLLRALEPRLAGGESAQTGPVSSTLATRPRKWLVTAALVAVVAVIGIYLGVHAIVDRAAVEPEIPPPVAPAGPDAATTETEPRIAVAPIRVRDNDPELADVAAALGEGIASGLSRFSYLLVATRLPGSPASDNAGYVLEGTLRRSG
jgi:hypothetical protein